MKPDISVLFPDTVAAVCEPIPQTAPVLYPEEQPAVANAVAVRKNEFAAGRACARAALAVIGIYGVPLKKNRDGTVQWPPGVVGSLTHSRTWSAAAVAFRVELSGIGLDTESISRVSPGLAKKILTQPEEEWTAEMTDLERQQWTALIFSAKESVYKCIYQAQGLRPALSDTVISVNTETKTFSAAYTVGKNYSKIRKGCLMGKYLFAGGEVFTGVVMPG